MKSKFNLLFIAFLLLSQISNAQFDNPNIEDYGTATEINLGHPDTNEGVQFIPIGIDLWDGEDVNTIYYGQVPQNSVNKPIMVFVHGYASNASVWFKGEDNMYWDVYRDGYRSAFVSLTPNHHMWTNGNMLANMLDQIIAHFGDDNIVLVGWSKGSVDIDAALVHSGAHSKVSQVFTLSAPHYGTGIAELANSILLSLVNIIFMQNNDATVCLKRGYMNYFRSLTDIHPNNTVHYTTIGAWGNGPLNRLIIPQEYLYLAGGSKDSGGNDGVVPYYSSRRPGGTELFSGQRKEYLLDFIPYYTGPDETNLDHYEITRGSKAWPHIKANLNNAYQYNTLTPISYNPNATVTSNMQIVTGNAGKTSFAIEENAQKVTVLISAERNAHLIRNEKGEAYAAKNSASEPLSNNINLTTYELEPNSSGKYWIESDKDFTALIIAEGGIEAHLNTGLSNKKLVYENGETVRLALTLTQENNNYEGEATVTGTILRTTDLQLRQTKDNPQIVTFKRHQGQFIAEINKNLPPGIYDIIVNASGNNFTKTVLTSIAVTGDVRPIQANASESLSIDNIYPNPGKGSIKINLMTDHENTELSVYNMFGQKVKDFNLHGELGHVELQWSISNDIQPGLYILQLMHGNKKVTKKLIIE
ncbi:T9SS type A sorting domain-containing protein [Fulvivirga sp. 29W222]|uniref:T9SS type A sorting domain-containing protein n=1 Tax=Fulvivirga marina TaxID=2494733 RepID=A0A937KDB2_9BACT|nr:T9SS type A sorting domain-containing protein [Fulvivirga marina]MBL6448427.1 T9SS type A sorting domain-containing protein [Fulvivirga marina]